MNWVDKLATWDFQQIIPCHFDAPISADSQQLRQSFAFLESAWSFGNDNYLQKEDFRKIQQIDSLLSRLGIIPNSQI